MISIYLLTPRSPIEAFSCHPTVNAVDAVDTAVKAVDIIDIVKDIER